MTQTHPATLFPLGTSSAGQALCLSRPTNRNKVPPHTPPRLAQTPSDATPHKLPDSANCGTLQEHVSAVADLDSFRIASRLIE